MNLRTASGVYHIRRHCLRMGSKAVIPEGTKFPKDIYDKTAGLFA